tara:strand:+ start:594 stop:2705 length:2112 start_codon:yes stop_codon:yes gene_type:complete
MNGNVKFGVLLNAKVRGENNIKRLGNAMQGVQGKAKNLGMAVKGVGTAFKALFAAAAIAGFSRIVTGAINSADAFGKLSTRTGIAADKLQAYANAGKLADVSQSDLETGLRTLARTQGEAADGVKTYLEAYSKLGLSVKKADGSLKASDQLLGEIADKFADLPNGPDKAAIAMDIFGRSGSKLITLLNGGTEALERFNYETSENFAQNAEYFNDQITILQIKFDGFRKQLADALLPALNAILEVFSDLFESGQDFAPLFKAIEIGIRGIASVILGLVQSMQFFIRTIRDLVKIATLVTSGKFGEAFDVAKTGLSDTRAQFFKDIEAQKKVLFGTSEVGADYGGGGQFQIGDLVGSSQASKDKKAGKEKAKMSKLEFNLRQQIRDARIAENEIAQITAEFDLKRFEIGRKYSDDILAKDNAILDAQLDKSEAINAVLNQRDQDRINQEKAIKESQQAQLESDPGYQMKQQLEELLNVQNQVAGGATAIGNAFANSFRSVVDGSKTAKEALADMMSAVAEHFMDMAAKIIAKQLAMILYGTIMKALGVALPSGGGGGGGFNPGAPSITGNSISDFGGGTPFAGAFAEGGFVTGPTNALIGEGGEPEYIVPASKMNEAMSRYSRGARGSAVIPMAGGQGAEGDGSTGTAVLDVRYTVERINNVDYVTAQEFQEGLSRATRQGAELGRRNVYSDLVNKRSVRSRVGL